MSCTCVADPLEWASKLLVEKFDGQSEAEQSDDEKWLALLLGIAALSFNRQTLQWNRVDGSIITAIDARKLIDRHIAQTALRLDVLAVQLQSGAIGLPIWQSGFRAILRPALLASAIAGAGGVRVVQAASRARFSALLGVQDAYLDSFAAALKNDPDLIAKPSFRARSALYPHAARGVYESERERLATNAGFQFERLISIRTAGEHCPDCIADVARGKVPIGTLKPIGTRQCLVLCTHSKEFSMTNP